MENLKRGLHKFSAYILVLIILIFGCYLALEKNEKVNNKDAAEVSVLPAEAEAPKKEKNEQESTTPFIDADTECALSEEEQKNIQTETITQAYLCADFYSDIETVDKNGKTIYASTNIVTETQRKEIVDRLGNNGLVCVSDDVNMTNYVMVEDFYSLYSSGQEAQVTIYEPFTDGTFSSRTFVYRQGTLQSFYVGVGWQKDGFPFKQVTKVSDIDSMKLTDKGYLIYTNKVIVAHGNLKEYYRVKPLTDECRELTRKYISGLSYVGYNVLTTNWDENNIEDVLMPCMFEDIYRIYSGEIFNPIDGKIPAEIYEMIMTTYFPVTVEKLRAQKNYESVTNSYTYEMIISRPLPPFGEVVDYTNNSDGSITIFVDGVWPDYDSDYAFTNQIVVKPQENGTFRYLSNTIQKQELEIPITVKR